MPAFAIDRLPPEHQLRSPMRPPSPRSPLPPLPRLRVPPSPYPSFNSPQLDKQLQRYLRLVAKSGPPDILIVGSSRALQGIDPITLQQALTKRGYPNRKVFNFGVNGATAQLVDLIVRKLLAPNQLPRVILWADGVRAFNSGRTDITYNRAIASQGYKLLAQGVRPSPPTTDSFQAEQRCAKLPLQRPVSEFTDHPKYFSFVPLPNSFAQLQRLCRESLKVLVQAEPSQPTQASLQELTGFEPLSNQFQPASYFQRYPKVPGAFDADYRDFSLEGKQTVALNNIMNFAQAQQIAVVFVNLPLTQIYLDEARTTYEQQFQRYLQRLARSRKLVVHDLSQRWLYRHDYFTDPSHLNRYGASAVAAQLGRHLAIPGAIRQPF